MKKRVLKIFAIVFGVAIALFGAIIGVMAIRGDFKKPHIEPTSLYFDLPYDEADGSYYMDVTYYCNEVDTKGERKSNIYYFILRSKPDDTTELDCTMTVESGSELIDFCDREGNFLSNADSAKVKINKPVYFKLSSDFDNNTENYEVSNGVVKIYFNSSNNLCNGYLTINIDRQVSSVSLYDFTTPNSNNNIHQNGKFNFEKVVYEPVSLVAIPELGWGGYYIQTTDGVFEEVALDAEYKSSEVYYTSYINSTLNLAISANDPYPLVPIYAPENSNKPFTNVSGKTCDIFIKNGNVYENITNTTSSYIYLDNEGVYRFISSEPGDHEFYLVTYPTYAIQKEAEEFFENETNTDNIIFNNEFAITRKVMIRVQNFGIQSVQFKDNEEVFNVSLNLFKDNYFVLDDSTLGANYTNLEVSMYNNKGYEEVSRLNQVKFLGAEDFIEGKITFTASSIGTEKGKAQILIDGRNAILSNFNNEKVDGRRNYTLQYVAKGQDLNGQAVEEDCMLLSINFDENDNNSLKLAFKVLTNNENGITKLDSTSVKLFTGNILTNFIDETFVCSTSNLLVKNLGKNTQNEVVYVLGTIKVGSYLVFTDGKSNKNGLFSITSSGYSNSKVFKVFPKEKQASLRLYLFVVNEDYSFKYTEKYVTISVDPENTTYTKETEIEDLKIKYSNGGLLIETSEIPVDSLLTFNTGSYTLPLMFVKDSNIKVHTVDVTITRGANTYRLVGYVENGKFVNSIKPLNDKMGKQDIYTIILNYTYETKTSEALAEEFLRLGNLLDGDKTNDAVQIINTDRITNLSTFENAGNIMHVDIVYAEKLENETSSDLIFVGSIYKDSVSDENLIDSEIYAINEDSSVHKFTVKIDESSAFKDSKILELFTGEDAENNLMKMTEYFNLSIKLCNEQGTVIQTGILDYTLNTDGTVNGYITNIDIINLYIKINHAKYVYNETTNEKMLEFEFVVGNDPNDLYVGSVLEENGRPVVEGYYFQLEFDYEGRSAVSSKLVINSTRVTGYVFGEEQYSFDDYKIVYNVEWDNTTNNYKYARYLKHKTDERLPIVPLPDGSSLIDNNLLAKVYDNNTEPKNWIDGEYIKAFPSYSSQQEYAYLAESSDNSVLSIEDNVITLIKTGKANITLTNMSHSETKTVIEVEIIADSLKLEASGAKEVADNVVIISQNGFSYGNLDNSISLFNKVISVDGKFEPLVKFSMESLEAGYYVQEVNADWTFESIVGYKDYLQIKNNGLTLVASKPSDWEKIDFEKEFYYKRGVNEYIRITSLYEGYVEYTEAIDWENVDLDQNYYFVKDENDAYIRITNANMINQEELPTIYTATPTWKNGEVYHRHDTVASLRLYNNGGEYQWRLVREENYVLTSIQFNLTAHTIVGSATVKYTYMSAVDIEKNNKHSMVEEDVITYYKGTNLQIASKVGVTDDDGNELNTLFKLTNDTGSDTPTFKLQYREYEEGVDKPYTDLGSSGDSLLFESNNAVLNGLELNKIYEARIYYNEYQKYVFKFKIVENLLYNPITDGKENSISNPHVLTWGSTNTPIDLTWKQDPETKKESGQIQYYEYKTVGLYYLDYDNAMTKETRDGVLHYTKFTEELIAIQSSITYDTDKYDTENSEFKDIIKLKGSSLELGWVQFAGSKTYAVKLCATTGAKSIDAVYYVKVVSDFSIEQVRNKTLPDLKAYEETSFDITEYFTIKNGNETLTITDCKVENQYVKVEEVKFDELDEYYVYSEGEFVAVGTNGTFDENEVYYKKAEYLVYDNTGKTLVYNYPVGGELYFEIEFTIDDAGTPRRIKAVDESGNNVLYNIYVEKYELPVKEDAQLIANGMASTLFTDLFELDWEKLDQIYVDDTNLITENSQTITSTTTPMLKLGVTATTDKEFEVEVHITLTYKNGETHEYTQKLKVVSAHYANITYDFNDLIEEIKPDLVSSLTDKRLFYLLICHMILLYLMRFWILMINSQYLTVWMMQN